MASYNLSIRMEGTSSADYVTNKVQREQEVFRTTINDAVCD